MTEADDDEHELSFQPLACANKRVVTRLFEVLDDRDTERGEGERSDETGSDKAGCANLTLGVEKRFKRIN